MSDAPILTRLQQTLGRGVFAMMVANGLIFLIFVIGIRQVGSASLLSLYDHVLALSLPALGDGYLWTLLTYGFLHNLGDPFHLLFNLLGLYFFGPMLERRVDTGRFLRFYLIAIVAGGVLQALASVAMADPSTTVGASAGVMALFAAFAFAHPDARVLLFFVVPVRARYLLPITVAVDVLVWLTGSNVALFAHLGGLAAAWVMLRGWPPRLALARLRGWRAYLGQKGGKKRPFTVINGGNGRPGDRSTWN